MDIGLIGCGKVGTSIFHILKKNNRIIGVYDIKKGNQRRAVKYLQIADNAGYQKICRKSQALFFATPDDKISSAFSNAEPLLTNKKYIFHFSGLLPSTIFKKTRNIYRASVHPFTTFPKIVFLSSRAKYDLFIEGDDAAIRAARQIFKDKYFNIKKIKGQNKTIYHLIGVFSSNLLIGLISAAEKLSRQIGWAKKDSKVLIASIMKTTLHNTVQYGIKNSLSGPLERGDIKTVEKHMKLLRKNKNMLNIYKTLSIAILENVADKSDKKKIKELLNS